MDNRLSLKCAREKGRPDKDRMQSLSLRRDFRERDFGLIAVSRLAVANSTRFKQVNIYAWRKTLKRTGIENFRWHDLRHTRASWHVQRGTPLHVLQEMGGWETVQMAKRYAHFGAEHLSGYAESFTGPSGKLVTK